VIGVLTRSRQLALTVVVGLAFLLVIVPATSSSIKRFVESGQGPLEEEKEDRSEEKQGAHRERSTRLPANLVPRPASSPRADAVQSPAAGPIASVAPPRHPSQFSVRRLR